MENGMLNVLDWKLGDCELRQASLRISGNFLIFIGQVCTHFTHTKDVWHIHLVLFTRNNTDPSRKIVLLDKSFDGQRMSEQDKPLFHNWAARFPINIRLLKPDVSRCRLLRAAEHHSQQPGETTFIHRVNPAPVGTMARRATDLRRGRRRDLGVYLRSLSISAHSSDPLN